MPASRSDEIFLKFLVAVEVGVYEGGADLDFFFGVQNALGPAPERDGLALVGQGENDAVLCGRFIRLNF
jgi:hypothetical protein